MSNLSKKKKVEIFHRINKLKLKAGAALSELGDDKAGFIDPKAVKRAQSAIDKKEAEYTKELESILVKLDSTWDDTKKEKDKKKLKKHTNKIYNYANNV